VTFVAERADSTVDEWTVSDSSVARVVAHQHGWARVRAMATGAIILRARRQADSGRATVFVQTPLAITPLLDTVTVGTLMQFDASTAHWDSLQWSLSDPSVATIKAHVINSAFVLTRAAGTVTVTASRPGHMGHATVVVREPGPGEFETIDIGPLDATGAIAQGVGDDGSIVGVLLPSGGNDRGFVYKDGVMHELPSSGGSDGATTVGPSGQIAGISYGPTTRVVIWDTPDAAPRLVGANVAALIGINKGGDVLFTTWVSHYPMPPTSRGVLWRDNVPVDLGDLSDSTVVQPSTNARAWNTRGQIVGWSQVRQVAHTDNEEPTQVAHPFIWENGVMRDLGVLGSLPCTNVATPADCAWGEATGINAQGIVVGNLHDAQHQSRAFIWENGVMRDLGVTGQSVTAIAINDRGQVLVQVLDQVLDTIVGRAFLWENGQTQLIHDLYPIALGPNGELIGPGRRDNHNFFWQAGQLFDLGVGGLSALNGHGEVVGWQGCCSNYKRPVLWRRKQ